MKNLFHFASNTGNGKYVYFSAETSSGEIPREKFANLETISWVKEQLTGLKKEIGSYENIDKAKTVQLLNEIKDVKWKGNTPPESAKYIFALQSALHLLGHGGSVGQIDALWGGKSKAGLEAFQIKWNADHPDDKIVVDGIPGPQSVGRILESLGEKKTETPKPTEAPKATPAPTEAPKKTPAPTEAPKQTPAPTEAPKSTPAPTEAPKVTPAPTEAPRETPAPTKAPENTSVSTDGFPDPNKIEFGKKTTGEAYSEEEKQKAKDHFETERLSMKLVDEKLNTFLEWSKGKGYKFSDGDIAVLRQELQKARDSQKTRALELAKGYKEGKVTKMNGRGNMSLQDIADMKAEAVLAMAEKEIKNADILKRAFSEWKREDAFNKL